MNIKHFFRKLMYGHKVDSETFINYMRKRGAKIGNDVVIFDPMKSAIDESRPYMIEIGDKVQITMGCTMLTHGYDWSVFKGLYGDVLGKAQTVKIGNNVFIGRNVTIMGGVEIGDNVVIGANAVVTKSIPSNTVAVGAPAKPISSIEDYYEKRKAVQLDEAKLLVVKYFEAFGKYPPEEELREFFWLFTPRKEVVDNKVFDAVFDLLGNREDSMKAFMESEPVFNGYQEFLEYCKK